ncbi:ArdC family protein [Aurantiacibacter zhengii]|uniref:DUF1738 domain-containing protein n=1 Tax=Aurantiacibacter zhengii TaxID=2307003 RepID=A0A418NU79_9SPHN|nr:zincin-like metallopeptidase domain-containing protein [Aurantiacibacter zhengii]RIV87490.1 DUF1738 domain-containing protein [Aurantiacibacter zhengii]
MAKFDTYQEVTDRVIAALEAGTKPWEAGWDGAGSLQEPRRANGLPYRGINVLLLWMAAAENGWNGQHWVTFKQAKACGAKVRKGEKGTRIVFFKQLDVERENDAGETEQARIPMLRTYTVFNADQVDDLPEGIATAPIAPTPGLERDQEREDALRSCGARITEGGTRAFYQPVADCITMPDFERFADGGQYLATLAHELCHWTGHKSRLDRNLTAQGPFGSPGYAQEELVAELGAAFIGARLGIAGDHIENHAAYLGSWLKALKNDKRHIFKAAAAAQRAADLVLENAGDIASNAKPASLEGREDAAPAPAPAKPAPAKPAPAPAAQEQFQLAL